MEEGDVPGNEPQLDLSVRELRRRLEEILARPKATRRDAEEAVEAAQAIADLMDAEERALRLVSGRADLSSPAERPPEILTGLTLHEAARAVLAQAGWPMHVRDLAVRVKTGLWHNPRGKDANAKQLALQLAARLPRHPEIFRRVAPNTFALAGWGDNPPRKERPKPLIGIFASDGTHAARDIDEELETILEDERNQWRSY